MVPPSYRRPTVFEIDLTALALNARTLMAAVAPATVMAIVKADAYGHGAAHVAGTLADVGVDSFGVATVDEGIELRNAGVQGRILVLSESPQPALSDALQCHLSLTVARPNGVRDLMTVWPGVGEAPSIHLSVDTGMWREGGTREEVREAGHLAQAAGLRIEGLFSHLARADEGRRGESCTLDQMAQFEAISNDLVQEGIVPQIRHLASTAGAICYPRSRYDMVRLGIALYGYQPSRFVPVAGLSPVGTLRSVLVARHELSEGQAVSYGHRRPRDQAGFVGIVPIGYADGVPRRYFEQGGEVLIAGERFPLAGTVTMDQIAIDLGQRAFDVGQEVVLIGRQGGEFIGADEWGELLSTISYEVLCGIGPRVPRKVCEHS
jgi:alanine racemase